MLWKIIWGCGIDLNLISQQWKSAHVLLNAASIERPKSLFTLVQATGHLKWARKVMLTRRNLNTQAQADRGHSYCRAHIPSYAQGLFIAIFSISVEKSVFFCKCCIRLPSSWLIIPWNNLKPQTEDFIWTLVKLAEEKKFLGHLVEHNNLEPHVHFNCLLQWANFSQQKCFPSQEVYESIYYVMVSMSKIRVEIIADKEHMAITLYLTKVHKDPNSANCFSK